MKKLPPYGRALRDRSGNEVFVCVGPAAWELAASKMRWGRLALVLPDNSHPKTYRWPVHHLEVLVIGQIELVSQRSLSLALLQAGATIVRVIHDNGELSIYRPEDCDRAA